MLELVLYCNTCLERTILNLQKPRLNNFEGIHLEFGLYLPSNFFLSLSLPGEEDGRNLEEMEQLIWLPGPNNTLTPKEIDQFLILARYI